MNEISSIFVKFALVGENLSLKENVTILINDEGKINKILQNCNPESHQHELSFPNCLLLPKFVNSHVHLRDSLLKGQATGLTLDEAVGINGKKFEVNILPRTNRVNAMRESLKFMSRHGTSLCIDFTEDGLNGLQELDEALKDLPIQVLKLGRPKRVFESDINSILSLSNGIGISTPITYSIDELLTFKRILENNNFLLSTHIGEEKAVIKHSMSKFGISDLLVALENLNPDIIIHLTYSDFDEISIIPKKTLLVFCPSSNEFFGNSFPPISFAMESGFLIGLGTDNIMINSPNILTELRRVLKRLIEFNSNINYVDCLKMITVNPTKALNLNTGIIERNYFADFLLVNLEGMGLEKFFDPIKHLLFKSRFPEDIVLNVTRGMIIE